MDYITEQNEPRSNAEQSETGDDLRVSFESRKALDHLDRIIAKDKKPGRISYVYFIGGGSGAIKIGRTCSIKQRLAAIQAHSPIPVAVLAITREKDGEREGLYHFKFAAHRLHGEWFERCPEILAEIERLA